MVTIYKVNDKEFNTFEEAKAYEEELKKKEQERIEKEKQKQDRVKELSEAANKYIELLDAYEKDYGTVGTYKNPKIKDCAQIVEDLLKFFY